MPGSGRIVEHRAIGAGAEGPESERNGGLEHGQKDKAAEGTPGKKRRAR